MLETLTQDLSKERLLDLYEECGGDAQLLGRKLGLSMEELAQRLTTPTTPPARRSKPPADLGHDYFKPFIVSMRHCENPKWPWEDQDKIEEARSLYEGGTHTMCQQRDRDWFVLFCVPLKKAVAPCKFFHMEEYG
jgi:hypothetical protein